jgi:putative membrane protein
MSATLAVNRRWQRDFTREWTQSLRLKRPHPLGEVELARMIEG